METAVARKRALIGENSESTFCVFNPTQFVRTDRVQLPVTAACGATDAAGMPLKSYYNDVDGLLEVEIPCMGPYEMRRCCLIPAKEERLKVVKTAENPFYCLQLQEDTGDLVGIWDKKQQRQLLAGPANVVVAMAEKDPEMEGALCLTGEAFTDMGIRAQSVQIHRTPIGTTVTCIKPFLGFRLKKQIILSNAHSRIDFVTDILDYTGEDYLLLTRFPFDMHNSQSVFETPFGTIEGRTGLHGAQKWAALREGDTYSAVLNRGTCGYWVAENTLSMALLRGHKNYVQYGINSRARGFTSCADGKTHTELAAERGDHRFCYALWCDQTNAAAVASQALMYNAPLEGWLAEVSDKWLSPVSAVSEGFIVTKLALTAENKLCLRGYWMGVENGLCRIQLNGEITAVWQANLLEENIKQLKVKNGQIDLSLRPFEIVTLMIERE